MVIQLLKLAEQKCMLRSLKEYFPDENLRQILFYFLNFNEWNKGIDLSYPYIATWLKKFHKILRRAYDLPEKFLPISETF